MQRRTRGRHATVGLLGRIDRAAGEINPYLVVVVAGLAVLNLICFAFMMPHLPLMKGAVAGALNPTTAVAGERPASAPRLGAIQ